MPLRDGVVVDQVGWQHRLTHDGALWTLWKRGDDGWEDLYAFDEAPQRPADYEVAHHYTATHPGSPFTSRLVVMRLAPGVSRRLLGDELTVEHAHGPRERTTIPPDHLGATLREPDVVLDAGELDGLLACL